jgi:hypothetical protein
VNFKNIGYLAAVLIATLSFVISARTLSSLLVTFSSCCMAALVLPPVMAFIFLVTSSTSFSISPAFEAASSSSIDKTVKKK